MDHQQIHEVDLFNFPNSFAILDLIYETFINMLMLHVEKDRNPNVTDVKNIARFNFMFTKPPHIYNMFLYEVQG